MTWSAAILTGGLSRRFGSPKYLATVGGEALMRRVARVVAPPSGDLLIVTSQDVDPGQDEAILGELAGLGLAPRIVRDTPGPKSIAAGIEAALLHAASGTVMVAGADLPFLSSGFIAHLVEKCRGLDAAVPFYKGFYEPACAVYTRRFLPLISRYRLDPKGPVSRCFEEPGIDVARVTEEEIRAFGDPDLLFLNVNTKEDLARAETLLASRRGELK